MTAAAAGPALPVDPLPGTEQSVEGRPDPLGRALRLLLALFLAASAILLAG